jgi:hypothetical protein
LNAPGPNDPQLSTRVADTLQFGAQAAIALGAIYAFLTKVMKPYQARRHARLAATITEVLTVQLAPLVLDVKRSADCSDRVDRSFAEQADLFHDLDLLLDIVLDMGERQDERNAVLVGRGLLRSGDAEQSTVVIAKLHELRTRRYSRRHSAEVP